MKVFKQPLNCRGKKIPKQVLTFNDDDNVGKTIFPPPCLPIYSGQKKLNRKPP